jgi:hypothetical protein
VGFAVGLVVLVLASCTPAPPRSDITPGTGIAGPVPAPSEDWRPRYDALVRQGARLLDVDPSRSLVTVEVRRAGRLASLGHDHVVASHAVAGYVAPREGRAEAAIALRDLVVDEPELRRAAGFDSQPSATDIEGTRQNMLRVLNADRHPFAIVALAGLDEARLRDARTGTQVSATVTLNGTTRPTSARIAIEPLADGLRATGQMTLAQTDFGIVPFSILNGAIEVADPLTIRFDVVARASPARSGDRSPGDAIPRRAERGPAE